MGAHFPEGVTVMPWMELSYCWQEASEIARMRNEKIFFMQLLFKDEHQKKRARGASQNFSDE